MGWLEVERRKVIRVGEASYAITLPKKWCSDLGIMPGATINLIKSQEAIVIKPLDEGGLDHEVKGPRIAIDGTRRNVKQLAAEIIGAYTEGVSEIKVKADKEKFEKVISVLKRRLPGLISLHSGSGKYFTIVFMGAEISIRQVIRKISAQVADMIRLLEAVPHASIETSEDLKAKIEDMALDTEGLYFLGIRFTRVKAGSVYPPKVNDLLDYLLTLNDLKAISESVTRISSAISYVKESDCGIKAENMDNVLRSINYVSDLYRMTTAALLEDNIDIALTVLSKEELAQENIESLMRELAPNLPNVMEEIQQIIRSCMSLARLVVSRCVRDKSCRCRIFPLMP